MKDLRIYPRRRLALKLKAGLSLGFLGLALWLLLEPEGRRDWSFLAIAIFMTTASALFLWQLRRKEAIEFGPAGLALIEGGSQNLFQWSVLDRFTVEPIGRGRCVVVTLAGGRTLTADPEDDAFILTDYAVPAARLARELTEAKLRGA